MHQPIPVMNRKHILIITLFFCQILPADAWEVADVPLESPWAREVNPSNVLPEYPRPGMVREEWKNLNGLWEFEATEEGSAVPFGRTLEREILVPFAWEAALSGIRESIPSQRAWYRRTFTVPDGWSGQRILLHFGAVDWECAVHVNGRFAGQHRGGFDPFSLDITAFTDPGESNELVIGVYDPGTDAGIAVGKQSNEKFADPGRYTYSPVCGIRQTVWIEPVPEQFIEHMELVPDIDREEVHVLLNPSSRQNSDELVVRITIRSGETQTGQGEGGVNEVFTVPVAEPRLWSPEDPFLYDVTVEMLRDGKVVDLVTSYLGMRKISIERVIENGRDGVMKLFLNNQFVFQMGSLDQGYWPAGLYTAPTDEALQWDLLRMKEWGFNMVRKHIKVEPARWYYHADRLGILVWQDMPSSFKRRTEAEKIQFESEIRQIIRSRMDHPSIVNWIVFNEHWGAYDVERITEQVMALDPSRLVTGNSGIDAGEPDIDYEVGHIKDNHHYRPPTNPYPTQKRAAVNGEYGAIGYKIPGHIWDIDGPWVHHNYTGFAAATEEYLTFMEQVVEFRDNDHLSGAVYTQWTDLENEMNGLYTYDRKVEKLDKLRVGAANRAAVE